MADNRYQTSDDETIMISRVGSIHESTAIFHRNETDNRGRLSLQQGNIDFARRGGYHVKSMIVYNSVR